MTVNRSWPNGKHTDLTWHAEAGQLMAGKLYVGRFEPEDARHVVQLKEGIPSATSDTYDPWVIQHDDHIMQDDVCIGVVDLRADAELVVQLHNDWMHKELAKSQENETPEP